MTPKFRKLPVVIEAQEFRVAIQPWPDGVHQAVDRRFYVETLEGAHEATDGDWIITGVQGERYPCKPDIFAETYEPVAQHVETAREVALRKRNE